MVSRFREQTKKELSGLSHENTRRFAWLCAVRALPFLGVKGNFDYWKNAEKGDERQKYLLAVLRALDWAAAYADVATARDAATAANFAAAVSAAASADVAAAATAADVADDAAIYATAVATAAASAVHAAAVATAADSAAAAASAAYAAAKVVHYPGT